jgi:hypothetical protein
MLIKILKKERSQKVFIGNIIYIIYNIINIDTFVSRDSLVLMCMYVVEMYLSINIYLLF